VQQFIAVLFVLLALWGALLFLRKRGIAGLNAPRRTKKQAVCIEQLDRIRLTPQHSIHVLQIDNRRLVVAVHSQGVTVLNKSTIQPGYALRGGAGAQ